MLRRMGTKFTPESHTLGFENWADAEVLWAAKSGWVFDIPGDARENAGNGKVALLVLPTPGQRVEGSDEVYISSRRL